MMRTALLFPMLPSSALPLPRLSPSSQFWKTVVPFSPATSPMETDVLLCPLASPDLLRSSDCSVAYGPLPDQQPPPRRQPAPPATLLGVPFDKVIARLDSLLLVLKSCRGQTCIRPWHPAGNVQNLHGALGSKSDVFYENQQRKVAGSEGPQFDTDGLVYRQGVGCSRG
ncbi:hypothetical protein BT67DRAFT_454975 [Trichocladium antarcticum]|uniref:Uncharacterized protein n=1 Tax=Trichocladium antarcticum TaxID=1450529 RepID=A0AAN6ZFU9_9PEZI|nr:hypothetical protein BT67DRAFT_454975 [Trichocladium antarcticum]